MTTAAGGPSSGVFGEHAGVERMTPGFGRVWAAVGILLVAVLVAGVAWSAVGGSATPAAHPDLFSRSLLLEDTRQLTVVDLTNGEATVQLSGVNVQVDAQKYAQVQAVPVAGGTFLVNRVSGTFNFLGDDDYVTDPGHGVGLGSLRGSTAAGGFADGADAYIVRYGASSTVSLVDTAIVGRAARNQTLPARSRPAALRPAGYAALVGAAPDRAGATAVSHGDLWTLERATRGCDLVELRPAATGGRLVPTTRETGLGCTTTSVEATDGVVGAATPTGVRLWAGDGPPRTVPLTGLGRTTTILPVTDLAGELWYLARAARGWSVFGITTTGRVQGPRPVDGIPAGAALAPPAWSERSLYTLQRNSRGQPALWVVDPVTGAVGTVAGERTYPAKNAAERATFGTAEVTGVGPRVVYNNPDSLLAVVVATDGSQPPVVVDKAQAVAVSATGPAEAAGSKATTHRRGKAHARTRTKTRTGPRPPAPAPAPTPTVPAPAFSQKVDCADTTEKPYQPTITAVDPSPQAALVTWSYQLVDALDCEPDTWTVRMTALGGAPQPTRPVQTVDGQKQLEFVGLRPTTSYQVVVTADINAQSTASAPIEFETGQEGPDAPTAVHTAVDASGNWVVSWSPCHTAACLVPADSWVVTGAACAGTFVGQPPSVTVPGATTTVVIPAGDLLGTSLSFGVHGILADGLAGNPTPDHACTQSWRAPEAGGIRLRASAVPAGASVTATLQVSPAPGPATARVYGSDSTTFVYSVDGRALPPTTSATATVTGLSPDQAHTTSVSVYPTGHPSAAVTVTGPGVRKDLPWPTDITASVQDQGPTGNDPDVGSGLLVLANLPSGTYQLTGTLQCGSTQESLGGALQGSDVKLPDVYLPTSTQTCTVSGLTLTDTADPSPYGGASHAVAGSEFSWPAPRTYTFDVTYAQSCHSIAFCGFDDQITFADTSSVPLIGARWTISASQPGQPFGRCSATRQLPEAPTSPVTLQLTGCPQITSSSQLDASVTYELYPPPATRSAQIDGVTGTGGTTTTSTSTTSTTTTAPTTSTTGATTTTTVAGATTTVAGATTTTTAVPAGAATRTGSTALAGVTGPAGPGGADRSGGLTLEIVLAAVALTAGGTGLRRRRRPSDPRRRRRPPTTSKGKR